MHAGRDEVKAYQSQLSLLPSAGRERVRAKVGDAPWLGSSVGQLVNKAAFTPNSFSERPNQFCENRKTGWGRARTCYFGQPRSLIRCTRSSHSQYVRLVLITCACRPTFKASSDRVQLPVHIVRTSFSHSSSPSIVSLNPFYLVPSIHPTSFYLVFNSFSTRPSRSQTVHLEFTLTSSCRPQYVVQNVTAIASWPDSCK